MSTALDGGDGRACLPPPAAQGSSLRVQAWAWPDAEALPVPEGGGTAAEILPMLCRAGGSGADGFVFSAGPVPARLPGAPSDPALGGEGTAQDMAQDMACVTARIT
ncbi:hypothetical protein DVR11_00135, partial [Paracoccus versutus]